MYPWCIFVYLKVTFIVQPQQIKCENLKLLLNIQWIFVILLSLFATIHFRGSCPSVEMLKGYMVRESLGNPGLE